MKRRIKKPIKIIIIIILLVVLLGSIGYIIYEVSTNLSEKNEYQELSNYFETKSKEKKVSKIDVLKEINNDYNNVIGWIKVDDTNINYPIVQGDDNDYYLTHNYKNEKSASGSIYLDKDVLLDSSENIAIYGHRNKYGLMFEDLLKYAKKDFYESHPNISIVTLNEEATYQVFAVFYSRVYYSDEIDAFKYYNFVNAEDEEDFKNYIDNVKKSSIYKNDIDVSTSDTLITLSTCEYSKENGRFVVVAKKLSE